MLSILFYTNPLHVVHVHQCLEVDLAFVPVRPTLSWSADLFHDRPRYSERFRLDTRGGRPWLVTPIISRSTLEMDWSSCCSDSLCGLREREERVCLREGEVEASFSLASGLYIFGFSWVDEGSCGCGLVGASWFVFLYQGGSDDFTMNRQ
jgi:hypothetical protein